MHRAQLRALLHAYNPIDTQEQAYKEHMLSFIDHYPDCFERSLAIGHVTASAWLLNKDLSQVLLMRHAKLDKWVQMGGHCDGITDVQAVALKEAQEESGINNIVLLEKAIFDIDIHLIPANTREQEHYHYDVRFLMVVQSDECAQKNSESTALRWFNKTEQLPTAERSVMRMHHKWLTYNNNS
jgi:8-oxo-dGTP pyrophosphatase MutT (NUDIX family)